MAKTRVTETSGAVVVATRPAGAGDPEAGAAHAHPGPDPAPDQTPDSWTETERYWLQVQELREQLRRLRPAN